MDCTKGVQTIFIQSNSQIVQQIFLYWNMPVITSSEYVKKPWYYFNAHLETIMPSVFNKVGGVNYERERLELPDGDFLDLDWLRGGFKRLIIISHGMEGSTDRHYVRRPAKFFHQKGWDILAWNNRGCGGEINRTPRTYHHGEIEDLSSVVNKGLSEGYEAVVILGLSMGGCQSVKYFGSNDVDSRVLGSCCVSVSFDLRDTSSMAETQLSGFYGRRFLNQHKKTLAKLAQNHEQLRHINLDAINTFDELHEAVTIKLFNFKSVKEFYRQASCINFIHPINRPVYVLNAKNDPFLGDHCYPELLVENHPYLYVEYPAFGGHVGFTIPNDKYTYIEYGSEKFINEVILSPQTSMKHH